MYSDKINIGRKLLPIMLTVVLICALGCQRFILKIPPIEIGFNSWNKAADTVAAKPTGEINAGATIPVDSCVAMHRWVDSLEPEAGGEPLLYEIWRLMLPAVDSSCQKDIEKRTAGNWKPLIDLRTRYYHVLDSLRALRKGQ